MRWFENRCRNAEYVRLLVNYIGRFIYSYMKKQGNKREKEKKFYVLLEMPISLATNGTEESSVKNLCCIRIQEASSSTFMGSSVHQVTVLTERHD